MKRSLLVFIGSFIAIAVLDLIFINIDLLVNPWLRQVVLEWEWYNYLLTAHGITGLYLLPGHVWLIVPLLFSAIVTFLLECF